MIYDRFFCSAASRANGEQIFGTVARIRSWLLLEYSSVWRRHAIEDSWLLPAAVKQHIAKLQKSGTVERSLLVRQEHHRAGPIRCFSIDSCQDRPRIHRHTFDDYEDLLNGRMEAEKVGGLLFAVCTHGRHDKCCARFGLPVACAMREHAGDRAWECSHVGGDRFAGNVVVFPYGIYYGRVVPENVSEIVRRSEMGEIWLPGYRGRSCFGRPVQIAEYFARVESGRIGIDDFWPMDVVPAGDNRTLVRLRSPADRSVHAVEYEMQIGPFRQKLTCDSEEESSAPQYTLRRYEVTPE